MRYPCLVLKAYCRTAAVVRVESMNEHGEPVTVFEEELMCNYQGTGKTVLTADKRLVQLSGRCLFPGDIAPGIPGISGGVVAVDNGEWRILQAVKARNPDGTVNYTEVQLV